MLEAKLVVETNDIVALRDNLTPQQTRSAISRAINYSIRRTRTQVKREIVDDYKMKAGMVQDNLAARFSTTSTLYGELLANARPESLGHFDPVQVRGSAHISSKGVRGLKRPGGRSGVFVTVVRGRKENIKSAFILFNNLKPIVMARGKYDGSKGFKYGKPRLPITKLNTKSVYWGSLHPNVSAPWYQFSQDMYFQELVRQLDRVVVRGI